MALAIVSGLTVYKLKALETEMSTIQNDYGGLYVYVTFIVISLFLASCVTRVDACVCRNLTTTGGLVD